MSYAEMSLTLKKGLNGDKKRLDHYKNYSVICELRAVVQDLVFMLPL